MLKSIKQPTLIMEGTLDKLSAAKYLGERIPNSKCVLFVVKSCTKNTFRSQSDAQTGRHTSTARVTLRLVQ